MSLETRFFVKNKNLYIRLKGELDQNSVNNLRYQIIHFIEKYNIQNLIMNMQYLEFMDSSGIGFIIGRYSELKSKEGKVILCECNTLIRKIISISGLEKICTILETEGKAKRMVEQCA